MKWLSQEWAEALSEALRDDDTWRDAAKKHNELLRYDIVNGPDGPVTYHVRVGAGETVVALGEPEEKPDITFTMPYDIAHQVARGEMSGQSAAMGGHFKADVNPMKVMRLVPMFKEFDRVEASLGIE